MKQKHISILLAGLLSGLTGSSMAGTEDWPPREWMAFGPCLQEHMVSTGFPDRDLLANPADLKAIPETLTVGDKTFKARTVVLDENNVDLGDLFDDAERGKTVHLLASVKVEKDTVLNLGASADWFMQWWVNGKPLYDTLTTGNRSSAFEISDHVFDIPLRAGENVLAVAVISGSGSFRLVAGDPATIKENNGNHKAAMLAGRRVYESRDALRLDPPIDFPVALQHFHAALEAAETDAERAAALQAIGMNLLDDYRETDYAAIRAVFEQIVELAEIGRGAGRIKAQALRGVAETWLREEQYDRARETLDTARELSSHPWDLEDAQLLTARTYFQQRRYDDAEREFEKLLAMEPRREQLTWEANALMTAARLVPQVRRDHPRLFFNADSWPAIKERALTRENERLNSMRTQLERQSVEDLIRAYPPMQRVMEAAFVWRVTGDEDMLAKAGEILKTAAPVLFFGVDKNGRRLYNRGYPFIAWIAALDWVWNDLPADERT